MTELSTKNNISQRFFANSTLSKQDKGKQTTNDPTPFGLGFQENYPVGKNSAGATSSIHQCPTQTPSGGDNNIDVEVDF